MAGKIAGLSCRSARRRISKYAVGIAALLCLAARASAFPIRDGASILVFPDVTTSEDTETVLQISNLGTSMVHVLCWYVRGEGFGEDLEIGEELVDFHLWLTARQPTQWVASQGRPIDWADNCTGDLRRQGECAGAGIDPGNIPALEPPFAGELLCVEADAAGNPLGGNRLSGQATRIDLESGDVSKYPAVRFQGTDRQDGDRTLCLGGSVSPACPRGSEFDPCARTWILSHPAEQNAETEPSVSTRIVIATCSLDLNAADEESVNVQFQITNEFEQTYSAATTVQRWAATLLRDVNPIFLRDLIGTEFLQTRIRVSSTMPSGVVVLAETTRAVTPAGPLTSVAVLPHREGLREEGDVIVLPEVHP